MGYKLPMTPSKVCDVVIELVERQDQVSAVVEISEKGSYYVTLIRNGAEQVLRISDHNNGKTREKLFWNINTSDKQKTKDTLKRVEEWILN